MSFLIGAFSSIVVAETLVEFDGGIGDLTVSRVVDGVPVRNDVRGVQPGGQPWVLKDLKAKVKDDGSIRVRGEGLLLAGGEGMEL